MLNNFSFKNSINKVNRILNPNLKNNLIQSGSEQEAEVKLSLATIFTISTVVVVFILWASFTNIEEVAPSPGVIMPVGQNYVIQHLEGGTVTDILVDNGEKVKAGQKLILLNPTLAGEDLKRLKNEEIALNLDLIRLQSFLNNKKIDRSFIINKFKEHNIDPKVVKNFENYYNSTLSLLEQQNLAKENELELLQQKLVSLKDDKIQLDKQIVNSKSSIEILKKAKDMYKKLEKSKTVSQISLINSIERYNEAKGELLELEAKSSTVNNSLKAIKQQINTLNSRYKEKAQQEIKDINSKLLAIHDYMSKSKAQIDNLEIKASADGIINGLNLDVGSVITPGSTVLEIVPLDKELIVEAKVSTLDIGHVRVGDPVNIKVSAYNYVKYGNIKGRILSISASTFLSKNNKPFYKTIIKLNKNYLGNNPNFNKVIPGMTVTADIKTGEKSLMGYLLKPIQRTLNDSFDER